MQRARIVRGELAGSRWELASRPLPLSLQPYVESLSGYRERCDGVLSRRELPGPQVVVIFELGPTLRVGRPGGPASQHAGGFVAGLDDGATLTEHDGSQHGIELKLTPIGARRFFGLPMSELTGRVVAIGDLLPAPHRDLPDRLRALPDWDARLDRIEAVLSAQLAATRVRTEVTAWALGRITASGGAVDIRGLARELGYSHKHVIDLFRDHVGMPPKLLARLIRFDRLVRRLKSGAAGSWAQLAVELGYYDQSHLARDVKHFTGLPPTLARDGLVDLAQLAGAPAQVNSVQDG